jgi:hypothetical protein
MAADGAGGGGPADSREGPSPAAQRLHELRGCWELACVLNFLQTFGPQLGLPDEVRAEALEEALLDTGCTQPLLHEVHSALIQALFPRTALQKISWRATLADQLARSWHELGEGPCPFVALPADAERAYDALSAVARVRALRVLCELRLDARGGDLRERIDGAAEAPAGSGVDYHGGQALGQDNRGARYFVQGLDSEPRLYRERSRTGAAVKRTLVHWKRRHGRAERCEMEYTQPGPLVLDCWELVATTGDAVASLGEELQRDRFPGTRNTALCSQLAELAQQVDSTLRKAEARRARLARQQIELAYSNIVWDEGRTRRARQQVSYTSEAYDAQFAGVLRRGGGADAQREPPEESPFVRRGRSGGLAEGEWADAAAGARGAQRGGRADSDGSDSDGGDGSDSGDGWREGEPSDDDQ